MAGPAAERPSQPPERLGPYELLSRLAVGGMAEVYVARRVGARGFTKHVALKRILPELARDHDFLSMFIDEARISARLSHPNLVTVFDFGEDDGELFMAMELVDGPSVAKLVRAAANRSETVPLDVSLHVALGVLRGLAYAHTATDEHGRELGLIHRDVSPGNVMLGQSGSVKLGDFGIVRAELLERRTESGQLKGKLGYMSPEQVVGDELDARSDLFTFAIVLAEMLTGRPLFAFGSEVDILFRIRDADVEGFTRHGAHVPEELRAVLYRALARDPADRYPTAAALAEAIEDVVRRRRIVIGPERVARYIARLGLAAEEPASVTAQPITKESARHVVAPVLPGRAGVAASFRVIMSDRSVTPPLSLARVLELIVSGVAGGHSPVSRDGGPFTPARDHNELARVSSSSALRWNASFSTPPPEAAIARATLPGVLFSLGRRRATGVLAARTAGRSKRIYLTDGLVEFASSTDPSELLGARLTREGLLLPVELDMALAVAPRFGGRVGEALVGMSILRPIELFRALAEQLRDRVVDLLDWDEGSVVFDRGSRSHEETLPGGPALLELTARGVAASYQEAELRLLLRGVHADELKAGDRAAPSPIALRLPDAETQALLAVGRYATLDDLVRELPAAGEVTHEQVLRGIFIGLSCGAVTAKGWPAPVELSPPLRAWATA